MWTNRADNTYCFESSDGNHTTVAALAVVYDKRPVIHIMNLDINASKEATMGITLAHETAHTFGLDEVYNNQGHDVLFNYCCVMEMFEEPFANDYYSRILTGQAEPFCSSCRQALQQLTVTKLYDGN